MANSMKIFKPKMIPQTGTQALKRINAVPQNPIQAMGIIKSQSFPEQTDERLENKFKALKSALARSTSGRPGR